MVKNNLRSSRERSVSESLQPSQTVAQDAKCPSAGKVRGEHELPTPPSVVVRRWESYVQASSEVSASVGSCFLLVPDFSVSFLAILAVVGMRNTHVRWRGSGTTQLHRVRNSGRCPASGGQAFSWVEPRSSTTGIGLTVSSSTDHHDWVTDGLSVVEDSSPMAGEMPGFLTAVFGTVDRTVVPPGLFRAFPSHCPSTWSPSPPSRSPVGPTGSDASAGCIPPFSFRCSGPASS